MTFNPLSWFRPPIDGAVPDSRRQFAAGLVVWGLAWLVVWWVQDKRVSSAQTFSARQQAVQKVFTEHSSNPNATPAKVREVLEVESAGSAAMIWLGTLVGLGLFWGGGLLIFRPLIGWGFALPWLRRCETVERLSLVTAAGLTLSAIILHWLWAHIDAWMLAAVLALLVLASAFDWKLPGRRQA